ncbi:hypothetical protein AQUCO_01700249v1 [Aquilegia coerulea]|uniref:C3H1-type domain-containing protein n=1 Tax=Aquilegia coerulea TaxID=218851 RepID=A0A2G5DMM5_AQUCA|nr:hypothetical protein AQUCO_01700249v1 [Aquilegia coerulea]
MESSYGKAITTTSTTTQSDPHSEWNSTGIEESMRQLVISGKESYPERTGEPNCVYYMRTGSCGYGARCRFNHPRNRSQVAAGLAREGVEYPEREGQPVCQYYLKTRMCKFGAACKFHHPKYGGGSFTTVQLNSHGYPLRPGEKECSYYVKTRQCKFGITCKFHHPQPASTSVPAPAPAPAFYQTVQSSLMPSAQQYGVASNWQVARPPLLSGSYLQGAYGHVLLPSGMVPISGWNPYPPPVSPVASPSTPSIMGGGPYFGMAQLSPSAPAYAGPYPSLPSSASVTSSVQNESMFPERPGQPECQYYLRTGHCKFGSSCRYHHPPEWLTTNTGVLSHMGLPLRLGAPPCSFYAQYGVCKFGQSCKFDHPMGTLSYSPSSSSLADMPVAPYPIGSSLATLAPSSSSSDLQIDFITDSNKSSLTARIPSSENVASGSVGSILSKDGSVNAN